MDTSHRRVPRLLVVAAVVIGVALGSYGIAAAASGSGSTSTASASSTAAPTGTPAQAPTQAPTGPPPGATAQNPWGKQRSDETLLTGDTAAKVKQLALAKVSGATVVRVETDADGHAAYEAHMVKADGTPGTVYVDKSFAVVGVETRPSRP